MLAKLLIITKIGNFQVICRIGKMERKFLLIRSDFELKEKEVGLNLTNL
jgi:hypothetical protein